MQGLIKDYCKQQCARKKKKKGQLGNELSMVQPSKIEPGRNRKYEQIIHKK